MNTTYIILAVAAALVAAILILAVVQKKKKATEPGGIKPTVSVPDPVIVEGIRRNALRFMGLYEGIYTAVGQQALDMPDAYREWHIRIESMQDHSQFHDAFEARFPQTGAQLFHLQELLRYIQAAGICRDTKQFLIADEKTSKQYIYLGGDEVCPGREYKVMKPCWTQESITVEQGILAPKEGL